MTKIHIVSSTLTVLCALSAAVSAPTAVSAWQRIHPHSHSAPVHSRGRTTKPHPGPRTASASIVHHDKLFLFGGATGLHLSESYGDLWQLHVGGWKWLTGSSSTGTEDVVGLKGVPGEDVHPGAYVGGAMEVVDDSLFLFSSRLWHMNLKTFLWRWVSGASGASGDSSMQMSLQGQYTPEAFPGARQFSSMTVVGGILYLFGGSDRSDLWSFDTNKNQWAWLSGLTESHAKGVYFSMSDGGFPGGRNGAALESFGDVLYVIAGHGYDGKGDLSDVWTFELLLNQWRWVSGSSLTYSDDGTYFRHTSVSTRLSYGILLFSMSRRPTAQIEPAKVLYFSFQSNAFQTLADEFNVPNELVRRTFLSGGILNSELLLFGGTDSDSVMSDSWSLDVSSLKILSNLCNAGQFLHNDRCLNCALGKYAAEQSNTTSCDFCDVGKQSLVGSSYCFACAVGKFSLNSTGLCVDVCPLNTFPSSVSSACMSCDFGYEQSRNNVSEETCTETSLLSWSWISGSSAYYERPHYVGIGVISVLATPGARMGSVSFVFESNLYLFGGFRNDLWKFQNEIWIWLSGTTKMDSAGNFGTRGVLSNEAMPGGLSASTLQVIGKNAYLFGGYRRQSTSILYMNTLWKLDILELKWLWLHGSSLKNQPANWGSTQRIFAAESTPNSRHYVSSACINDTFYVFGGFGGLFWNDLWAFNTSLNMWAWLSGNSTGNIAANYEATNNHPAYPGSRSGALCASFSGNLYVFGGRVFSALSNEGNLNDMWKYDVKSNEWNWVAGTSVVDHPGIYSQRFELQSGVPSARHSTASSLYKNGLVIFGGQEEYDMFGDVWYFYFDLNKFVWLAENAYTGERAVSFPENRSKMIMETFGNELLLYGGMTKNGYLADLWRLRLSWNRTESFSECGPGKYGQNDLCFFCPFGKFSNMTSNSFCHHCPVGVKSLGAVTFCKECVAGKFGDGGTSCRNCPSGRFSNSTRKRQCEYCSSGYGSSIGQSSCYICQAGRFSGDSGDCVDCPMGKFSNQTGQEECDNCLPGYGSSIGKSSCDICPAGRFQGDTGDCIDCPMGKFSNQAGQQQCDNCLSGYGSSTGQSWCHSCPAGRAVSYWKDCRDCLPGKFSSSSASTVCSQCAFGHESTEGSTTCNACAKGKFLKYYRERCQNCPSGKYQNKFAQRRCSDCPSKTWSTTEGSSHCQSCYITFSEAELWRYGPENPTKHSDCYCEIGFYGTPYVTGGGTCEPCLEGTKCPKNTSIPIVLKGFGRNPNNPAAAYPCNPPEACLGSSTFDHGCAEGYFGDYCAECDPSKYFRKNEKCEKCSKYSQLSFVFYFIAILFGLYALLQNATPQQSNIQIMSNAFFWLQILDLVGSTVERWPPLISKLFAIASLLNFDLELFEPECSFGVGYWMKWHLKMTAGLILGAMQLYFYVFQEYKIKESYIFDKNYPQRALRQLRSPKTLLINIVKFWQSLFLEIMHFCVRLFKRFVLRQSTPKANITPATELIDSGDLDEMYSYRTSRYVYAYGFIVNSIYVMIAKASFEMLQCDFQSTGIYTLRAFIKQQCFDAYWYQISVTNIIVSFHWLIAFPAYLLSVLIKNKIELNTENFIKHYGSFLVSYKTKCFFWPLAEILFKLSAVVITKLVWFYFPAAGFGSFIALVVVYDSLMVWLKPYKKDQDTWASLAYVYFYESQANEQMVAVSSDICAIDSAFGYRRERSECGLCGSFSVLGTVVLLYNVGVGVGGSEYNNRSDRREDGGRSEELSERVELSNYAKLVALAKLFTNKTQAFFSQISSVGTRERDE